MEMYKLKEDLKSYFYGHRKSFATLGIITALVAAALPIYAAINKHTKPETEGIKTTQTAQQGLAAMLKERNSDKNG